MFGVRIRTNLLSVCLVLFLLPISSWAQEYIYTYAPHSMIVQPMIQSSPDEPSDCVLLDTSVVVGTTGPHLRSLLCRAHPSYGENAYNEGVFGIHGIVPPGTSQFDITVDVYSESSSSGNLCAVVSNTVIATWAYSDSGVTQGVRYENTADDTIHSASVVIGPVSVSSSNRVVSLKATNVPLKSILSDGTIANCTAALCGEQYFRMEVYIQGCQRLCSFGASFSCCGTSSCTNIGKVRVLGATLRFVP